MIYLIIGINKPGIAAAVNRDNAFRICGKLQKAASAERSFGAASLRRGIGPAGVVVGEMAHA
ncbi:hypothetical protein [Acidithiobacillus sp.]